MQKRKIAALAGVTLLSAGFLAACGNSSSSSSKEVTEMTTVYATDPQTLDYTVRNATETSDYTTNMVDGLMENDKYGNLVGSLAEDWSVSKDGKTYTYTLRKGAKWYTSDGEEYAEVKAQDFVTGLKHAADNQSEGLYLVQDSIAGLADYVNGKTTDFSTVGVKALDDYTVQYTLNAAEPFWNSKTTVGVLFPINEEFLKSKGSDFGKASADSILVNGAYFMSAWTQKSAIELTKNEDYWDADNVHIESIKYTYDDGKDPASVYNGFDEGTYVATALNPNQPYYEKAKEKYGDNIVFGQQSEMTYYMAVNVNRSAYNRTSKTTDEQKASTKSALLNKDFRQAIAFGINREAYAAQTAGTDAASKSVRATLTPSSFVSVSGKDFGDVVESEITSYGDQWKDVDLTDQQNGAYSPEKAKEALEKAKTALKASNVTYPVHLDLPVNETSPISVQQAQSLKKSIEDSLGTDSVVVDLQMMDETTYTNEVYGATTPDQNDFDLSTAAGWGPDYEDPSTYLDIMSPETGATVHFNGIEPGKNTDVAQAVGLDKYQELLDAAAAEKTDLTKRYELYAKAQAWLTDSALTIPTISYPVRPRLTKAVPYTGSYGTSGTKGSELYKGVTLQSEPITTEDYNKAREKWLEEKAESNKQYQEELAKHVK